MGIIFFFFFEYDGICLVFWGKENNYYKNLYLIILLNRLVILGIIGI